MAGSNINAIIDNNIHKVWDIVFAVDKYSVWRSDLSKTEIKPGELWGGAPAKFIKMVDPEQSKEINQKIAKNYLMYSEWYKNNE